MDFWDLTKLLYRRWYVSVPLLLLTLGGTVTAAMLVKPDYVATSYVQMIPPSVSTREPETKVKIVRNPWLDTGLNSLAKAALLTVQDTNVADQLKATGFSEKYTITLDNQLPTLTIEVVGTTKVQAKATTEELTKRFAASVVSLQREANAPTEQFIDSRRLDQGDNITLSTSKTKRALVAIFGAGLLISVGFTVAVDALIRRRSGKRSGADEAEDVAPVRDDTSRTYDRSVAAQPGTGRTPAPQPAAEERSGAAAQDKSTPVGVAPSFEKTKRLRPPDEFSPEATIVLPAPWTEKNGRAKPR